jgi:hypothetical protein
VTYAIGLMLIAFAGFGFWHGWLREATTLAGLLLTWSLVLFVGRALIGFLNRLYLILVFTVQGGFDSRAPGAMIDALRRSPPIDPRHPELVFAVLFVALLAVTYLGSFRYVARVDTLKGRLLGALVGLADGYLVVYLALRFVAPVLGLGLQWSGFAVASAVLERNLTTLLVVGVCLIVGIALLSSSGGAGRGRGRAPAPRARSRAGEAG